MAPINGFQATEVLTALTAIAAMAAMAATEAMAAMAAKVAMAATEATEVEAINLLAHIIPMQNHTTTPIITAVLLHTHTRT